MPKPFSERERESIRGRLMALGLERFMRQGVRGLRIDELCRDVGIAKGSFYAFFDSKEALFFALADQHDERHKTEMMAEMQAAKGNPQQTLGSFFDMVMVRLETDPLIRIIQDSGELAYVMRHAPPDYVDNNLRRDREFVAEMSALFAERHGLLRADPDTLEGVMTLMVSMTMQADFLRATGTYAPTVALLRDMFIKRAIQGPSDD